MFSMDDFEKANDYYEKLPKDIKDSEEFLSSLMLITHNLKNIDYESLVKSGDILMMRTFNMTGIEANDENIKIFDIILGLITHIIATLTFIPNKEEYFKFFDNVVIYPLMEK